MEITRDANGYAANGSRPSSARRNFIAAWLLDYAGHACTVCGCETVANAPAGTPSRAVVMHIVPSGPRRMGWLAGNLVSACEACNAADGGRDLTPYVSLFAGSVPASIPAGETYAPTQSLHTDETDARRMARAARGIDY